MNSFVGVFYLGGHLRVPLFAVPTDSAWHCAQNHQFETAGILSKSLAAAGDRQLGAISLRIADPGLNCSGLPATGASPQVNRRRKSLCGDAPIDRRATQPGDAQHVPNPVVGRRWKVALAATDLHDGRRIHDRVSVCPRRRIEQGCVGRASAAGGLIDAFGLARAARRLAELPQTCRAVPARVSGSVLRCRAIHASTSVRHHPNDRPWKRVFFGNLPSNAKAARIQGLRFVRRVTSWAVRSCWHAGSFSLGHLERETRILALLAEAAVPVDRSLLMVCTAHVWFRSPGDELSLEVDSRTSWQMLQLRIRAKNAINSATK